MSENKLWWERPDLRYRDGRLEFAGRVGGYGSAAASNHCMRGAYRELLLPGDN